MNMNTNVPLSTARQHLHALGLELPKALVDALAATDAALADRTALRYDRAALLDAVANCLTAGRNPLTDKSVREHLVASQLNSLQISAALDGLVEQRRAAAVTEHAPAVLDLLAPVVADADATLAEAREAIPGLNLKDVTSVSGLRPAQMQFWGRAREAAEAVHHIEVIWTTLARECRLVQVPDGMGPLIVADLTLEQLEALPRANSTARPNAASVIEAGHRLNLATPKEFAERCQRMSEAREQRDARRERELQAAGFDRNRRNAVA